MDPSAAILVLVALGLVTLLTVISLVNRLTRLRHLVRESWAQVDVALKRRYDLIPNLVETCRAYAAHERELLERVLEARNRAASSQGPVDQQAVAEEALVLSLNGLFARAEAYPALQSSQHFLELQRELANTEDRIAAARRFYNANVRDYNTAIEQFPASLFASGYAPAQYFEIDSVEVLRGPDVRTHLERARAPEEPDSVERTQHGLG